MFTLGHACTKEVGYVYCAPKYVFMNFLLLVFLISFISYPMKVIIVKSLSHGKTP
jgi:hypothetical protein